MSIDATLYELSQYVYGLEPIMVNSYYNGSYEYTDTDLIGNLIIFPNDEVIPRLESLLNVLKSKTRQDVSKLIPDNKYWEWDSEEAKSKIDEERQALFKGIKKTQDFISEIIEIRLKMVNTKSPKLFNYINNEHLNKLKNCLLSKKHSEELNKKSNRRLIDETENFVAIFRGEAPNARINWTGNNKNHFCYFIKELFIRMFSHRADWEIVRNTFLFNGEPIPYDIDSNNSISENDKKSINSILSVAFD